jgi:hypothetical protein
MKEKALKLADELDALHQYVPSEAPAMIRRLVEELDEKNYRILELTKRYKALTWNDKQSEPVVYWDGKHFASREKSSLADIPLYTTPQTKPLSDEEIEKVFDNTFKVRDFEEAFLKFARAIEERHGIK